MAEEGKNKVRQDIYFGEEGVQRLKRLVQRSGMPPNAIVKEALLNFERSQSLYRDTIRDAVLALWNASLPDEPYDPAEDPRVPQAVQELGHLLDSPYAAEEIALAFSLLQTKMPSGIAVPFHGQETSADTGETWV